jgi:hypothetical protein
VAGNGVGHTYRWVWTEEEGILVTILAQLPGPTPFHAPGPMELVIVLAVFLLSVALPILVVVRVFLYLRRIDRRLEL